MWISIVVHERSIGGSVVGPGIPVPDLLPLRILVPLNQVTKDCLHGTGLLLHRNGLDLTMGHSGRDFKVQYISGLGVSLLRLLK